ncbi:hypothetical protein AKJ09_05252 [Labilithrix luteola]|uniref:Tryptophan synthase alpha chain n=1 Tax=Labilithrix luteola TaxID=1391654 RepID=A0A0K1PYI4_9BACT|nr:hypothetical protein [Labilithrix luteola]AKU98588.1 hypothetical protein AKJ09_05252 [Labilithrix luteola]
MSKKLFVVATLTVLVGTFAVLDVGCSSSDDGAIEQTAVVDAGGPEVDASKAKDSAVVGDEKVPSEEEGTVGATCTRKSDCTVAGTINDNVCSNEAFSDGDHFASSVCIQLACTRGPGGSFEEMLCDDKAGFCLPNATGSLEGTCLPLCLYSSTSFLQVCKGDNRCAFAHPGADNNGVAVAIGYCTGGCNVDADCKGTPGQRCQVETGTCVNGDKVASFAKKLGEACDGSAASPGCPCAFGKDETKGVCSHACRAGSAGNDVCAAAGGDANWKCTAKLPTTLTPSTGGTLPGFTGQPDGVVGSCAFACPNGDADCAALSTKSGAALSCVEFADGKYCDFPR